VAGCHIEVPALVAEADAMAAPEVVVVECEVVALFNRGSLPVPVVGSLVPGAPLMVVMGLLTVGNTVTLPLLAMVAVAATTTGRTGPEVVTGTTTRLVTVESPDVTVTLLVVKVVNVVVATVLESTGVKAADEMSLMSEMSSSLDVYIPRVEKTGTVLVTVVVISAAVFISHVLLMDVRARRAYRERM
jgi:hypothetical protein